MTMKTITPFAVVLSAGTMFGTFAAAAPSSVYSAEKIFSYETGTPQDYDFISDETDETGTPITRYYKIGLNPENFATSSNIKWQEVGADKKDDENVVAVPFLNGTKYYRYTYGEKDRKIYTEWQNALSGDVTADFINGRGGGSAIDKMGGIVYNEGELNSLTGDFVGNSTTDSGYTYGGAIYNKGTINRLTGNFIGNYLDSSHTTRNTGGAIQNHGTINNLSGNFLANHTYQGGGAVSNYGYIQSVNGDFIGNYTNKNGGAVLNSSFYASEPDGDAFIGNISGTFIGNKAGFGGAVYNSGGSIENITGDFINNSASGGGAVHSWSFSPEGNTSGTLIVRFVVSYQGETEDILLGDKEALQNNKGYFVVNSTVEASSREEFEQLKAELEEQKNSESYIAQEELAKYNRYVRMVTITNSSFYNNKLIMDELPPDATEEDKELYKMIINGGAVSGSGIEIAADADVSVFSGNTGYGGKSNAVYVTSGLFMLSEEDLTVESGNEILWLKSVNSGRIIFDDGIDGIPGYMLSVKGDAVPDGKTLLTPQYIKFNNEVANAGDIEVVNNTLIFDKGRYGKGEITASEKDTITFLSLNNAAVKFANGYRDEVKLAGWKAAGDSYLHIDVDVENLTADMLNVNGNVEGTTKLVLYPTSGKDIRGKSILFARSENDTTGNADSFKVWRVYGSPYMFEVDYEEKGNGKEWGLVMNDEKNPDQDTEPTPTPEDPAIPDMKKPVNPVHGEVIAYGALPAAAIEQTRSMVDNVAGQTGRTNAEHNLWINPTYYTSNIDAPFDIDADVWGVEAGGDLQHDINNKIGLFVSYRKGSYDMNGDGKHYYSTVGSEVDIDSYLAGLYYRYDRNNWYAFATLYGGIQEADIKTDDGVKSDTDGVEFGGSVEAGYDYSLTDTVYLTPSLGVFYTQVNYDDATDNVGKKAKYGDLQQIELEVGVKLTKAFWLEEGYANLYVKPSIVQTIVDGDEVNITGLGKVNTLDDETLGRIELGGRYGFTDQLSAYGWANYTFGSDYDATTVGLGLNYAF